MLGDDETTFHDDDEVGEYGSAGGDSPSDAPHSDAPRMDTRARARSAKELLLEIVPRRSEGAAEKLRLHLAGKIRLVLTDLRESYLLNWTSGNLQCSVSESEEADCSITLTERELLNIHHGDLNPQIAMLSHRVKVEGKIEHAIYVFNLIAPAMH